MSERNRDARISSRDRRFLGRFRQAENYCQYSKGNEHLVLVGAKSPATIAATVLEAAQQRAALKRDGHTERSLVPQTARRGGKTGPRALS